MTAFFPTQGRISNLRRSLSLSALSAFILASPALADWPNTNDTKWVQYPDEQTGYDVRMVLPVMLADDFLCTNTAPITDIHIWTSYLNDIQPNTNAVFTLSIWSDVAAGTGGTNYSRPGTRLWTETFTNSQYQVRRWLSNTVERFWNPDQGTNGIIGFDTNIWQYNFYPTNPFVQQGAPATPIIYWLSVSVRATGPSLVGWKTSTNHWNDDAVFGHTDTTGNLLGFWQEMRDPTNQAISLDLSFALTTPPVCCPESNGCKFVQSPDLYVTNYNVLDSEGTMLASQFYCTNQGTITDIHFWGSWLNDQVDTNMHVWIGIYTNSSFASQPGALVWQQWFGPGQYQQCLQGSSPSIFYDPNLNLIYGTDSLEYYYCFYPTHPFTQQGTIQSPATYWLAVYGQTIQYAGWTTATNWAVPSTNYLCLAAWTVWTGNPTNNAWIQLNNPQTGSNLPLAFKLTTDTNPPPTVADKWLQVPDTTTNGVDVLATFPKILADDFRCNATGPITQVRIWGSWRFDQVPPVGPCFCLSLWDDFPEGPGNPWSRPNNQLCNWCFSPAQYTNFVYESGVLERFYDPNGGFIGSDTNIWEYVFDIPTNLVCWQTNGNIYWLSVAVDCIDTNFYMFGWKSCPTNWNDDAVTAFQQTFNGVSSPFVEMFQPPYFTNSLNLSFEIITTTNGNQTNPCPFTLTCAPDKTVECSSPWTFDPPLPPYDPCCLVVPPTFQSTRITNGICPQVIQFIWSATNCLGSSATCTQTVTVVDTVPPSLVCASNKTVQCNTAWNFDPPTATDNWCTNVDISIVDTLTNGICPRFITRTWKAIDCCTNTANCSQTVTITDTNKPSITCPSNIVVLTCLSNVTVTWSLSATDVCSSVTVTSSPPSGATFLPNTTNTVVAIATDACGNTNICNFTVTIRRPVLGPISVALYNLTNVVLTWTNPAAILQSSTNVIGPYTNVPGATSPYTNRPPPPTRFYRLCCPTP